MCRRNKHEIPVDPESFVDNENMSVSDEAEFQDEANSIVEIILNIPALYRDVLYLAYVEEQTVKEIAVILGISEDTVYKRMQRGRKMLEEEYRK